jgi:hypothetical protein
VRQFSSCKSSIPTALSGVTGAQAQRAPPDQSSTREHTGERGLPHVERVATQIVAVELDQVEGIQEHSVIMLVVPDPIEGCDPVVTACDCLAVDDAGPRAQPRERFHDQREAMGQVVTWPAVELHPLAILAGDAPEAVVLDLVQPRLAGRRVRG